MKIIHCADIHIGSAMNNLPLEKSRLRKREIIDTFFNLVKQAGSQNVCAVIIAGDFFDTGKIARSTRREILSFLGSFPNIDFLYLKGNHDSKAVLEDDELPAPTNLHRFNSAGGWTYFNYDNVCIAGIDISKQSGGGFYEQLRLDKNNFNIAVMHGDLQTLNLDRLKGKHIDYLALGDIHMPDIQPKRLDFRGVYGYSGCLEGRGFDELGERGFFMLEVENGKLTRREFCSVAKRRYEEVEVDITGLDTHFKIDSIIREKTSLLDRENIVRVVLKGKRNADTQIEKTNLENKLIERFFHAAIKDQSALDMNSVSFESEISLRSEFVKLVGGCDLELSQKQKIIEYGIKALRGEEISL